MKFLKEKGKNIIIGIGVLLLVSLPCFADPSQKDLEKVEEEAREQSLEHKKLQAEANKINIELASVSQEMIESARLIQNYEERLSKMEKELDLLREDLAVAEANFMAEDENLIRTLAALQNLAMKPTEALFVQPLSPVEIVRSAMLLRETVPYLEENAAILKKELEKIDRKKQDVENQLEKIQKQKDALKIEHEQMKLLVQKKSRMRTVVEIESAKTQKKVKELAGQAQDLRDLLYKLEEKKKSEQEKARAEAKKIEDSKTDSLIKFKAPTITGMGDNFVKSKGKLLMPAVGPVITYFGNETAKGVMSKGIAIKTRNSAQVIAPFDGSVIFSGPFRGYGNIIIIEHGKGYLSLLAGLEDIDCELGQMLLAGEPVGKMPNDDEAKLYVEIRKDNRPLNPLSWITK